jgi:hypothetical protein
MVFLDGLPFHLRFCVVPREGGFAFPIATYEKMISRLPSRIYVGRLKVAAKSSVISNHPEMPLIFGKVREFLIPESQYCLRAVVTRKGFLDLPLGNVGKTEMRCIGDTLGMPLLVEFAPLSESRLFVATRIAFRRSASVPL